MVDKKAVDVHLPLKLMHPFPRYVMRIFLIGVILTEQKRLIYFSLKALVVLKVMCKHDHFIRI